jgi:hypothetical protein
MTQSKKKWPVIAGVIFILGFIAAMLLTTSGNAQFHCEVCLAFNGQTKCRTAGASAKDDAQRAATNAACSDLGIGGFECSSIQPVSVKWNP